MKNEEPTLHRSQEFGGTVPFLSDTRFSLHSSALLFALLFARFKYDVACFFSCAYCLAFAYACFGRASMLSNQRKDYSALLNIDSDVGK